MKSPVKEGLVTATNVRLDELLTEKAPLIARVSVECPTCGKANSTIVQYYTRPEKQLYLAAQEITVRCKGNVKRPVPGKMKIIKGKSIRDAATVKDFGSCKSIVTWPEDGKLLFIKPSEVRFASQGVGSREQAGGENDIRQE